MVQVWPLNLGLLVEDGTTCPLLLQSQSLSWASWVKGSGDVRIKKIQAYGKESRWQLSTIGASHLTSLDLGSSLK